VSIKVTDRIDPFPFEFTVVGLPLSHQTKNKPKLRAWKARVRAAAEALWPPAEPPTDHLVKVTVVCYYESRFPDVDNFHKPIQDALQGLVYKDDKQVTDGAPSRREINSPFVVRYMSPVLASAFVAGDEFVHVIVDHPPDPTKLIS
jgi:crossover junction endodeoxyribonuclease RusA